VRTAHVSELEESRSGRRVERFQVNTECNLLGGSNAEEKAFAKQALRDLRSMCRAAAALFLMA